MDGSALLIRQIRLQRIHRRVRQSTNQSADGVNYRPVKMKAKLWTNGDGTHSLLEICCAQRQIEVKVKYPRLQKGSPLNIGKATDKGKLEQIKS